MEFYYSTLSGIFESIPGGLIKAHIASGKNSPSVGIIKITMPWLSHIGSRKQKFFSVEGES